MSAYVPLIRSHTNAPTRFSLEEECRRSAVLFYSSVSLIRPFSGLNAQRSTLACRASTYLRISRDNAPRRSRTWVGREAGFVSRTQGSHRPSVLRLIYLCVCSVSLRRVHAFEWVEWRWRARAWEGRTRLGWRREEGGRRPPRVYVLTHSCI